jgi:serine/threonine protein kinase
MSEPRDVGHFADDGSQDPRVVEWAAEIADRIQAGEPVDLEELTRAHPERAALLRRLLPAIEMMAGLRADPVAGAGAGRRTGRGPEGDPEVLGDFQLVRELGHGGMGVVYEARQLSLGGRRVAVKILPAATALDSRQVRRFQVEVQAAACLDHEHIVPVYAVGHERGVSYYVMRLIEGRNLGEIIRERRRLEGCEAATEETGDPIEPDALTTMLANMLASGSLVPRMDDPVDETTLATGSARTVDAQTRHGSDSTSSPASGSSTRDRAYFRTVARLGVQAAEALDYAHREGVLHRDIKPANLLVDPRGHLWVTDFGLARLRGNSDLTRTGDVVGTLRYMSPEQAQARRIPIDHRTDVYSLGVTIYEMLTLRPAFGGTDRARLLRRIAEEEPRPPRRLNRRIHRDLETVVLKAMAKEPARRYQSAGELAADLGRFLEGLPVRARRVAIWRRVVTWVKAHRTTAILIAMGVASAVMIASVRGLLQRKEAEFFARRFETASVTELAEIIPHLDLSDPSVVAWLDRLYAEGDPGQKLAAALMLAPTRAACKDHILDQFLNADQRLIRTLLPLLRRRIPEHLIARLESEIDGGPVAALSPAESELSDRRRANAACALIILGRDGRGWSLLRSAPDPQARSFFIAALGPAGVEPERLVGQLNDPLTSSSIRSAVIQGLDLIPEALWPPNLHADLAENLLRLYRDDPDAGVHGSAKWLLRRWGRQADLAIIDRELAGTREDDPPFHWRISREGLTVVTVDSPSLDRIIEVSDTEISVETYKRLCPDLSFLSRTISPDDSHPMNSVSYYDAAAFCNELTTREGMSPADQCFVASKGPEERFSPSPNYLERRGFRLPTRREFEVLCAAGTRTSRYCGESEGLLSRYAWTLPHSRGHAHPVGSLLPNDLGLFDTLGNLLEWCQRTADQGPDHPQQQADLRGGHYSWSPPGEVTISLAVARAEMGRRHPSQGFRVVRTKQPRDNDVTHRIHNRS